MDIALMSMGNIKRESEDIQMLLGTPNATAIQHAAQPHLGGSIDLKL